MSGGRDRSGHTATALPLRAEDHPIITNNTDEHRLDAPDLPRTHVPEVLTEDDQDTTGHAVDELTATVGEEAGAFEVDATTDPRAVLSEVDRRLTRLLANTNDPPTPTTSPAARAFSPRSESDEARGSALS